MTWMLYTHTYLIYKFRQTEEIIEFWNRQNLHTILRQRSTDWFILWNHVLVTLKQSETFIRDKTFFLIGLITQTCWIKKKRWKSVSATPWHQSVTVWAELSMQQCPPNPSKLHNLFSPAGDLHPPSSPNLQREGAVTSKMRSLSTSLFWA